MKLQKTYEIYEIRHYGPVCDVSEMGLQTTSFFVHGKTYHQEESMISDKLNRLCVNFHASVFRMQIRVWPKLNFLFST